MNYYILGVILVGLLAFDLYAHRGGKEITLRSASLWSVFYVLCGLSFAAYISVAYSAEWAQLFLAGYALEKVLAVDNLFAFLMIFSFFGVASNLQHRILYWGIIGAIVFRGIFVYLGTSVTAIFGPWAELVFAAIIGWTAYKMFTSEDDGDANTSEVDYYADKWYIRLPRKIIPVSDKLDGNRFFTKIPNKNGKLVWAATPLFLCLIAIELSDVVFAFDSVPAIIAVTKEPYLIYSAMMFAILGLRSLYFVLEALRRMLSKLETMVIIILMFIAAKLGIAAGSELGINWGLLPLSEPIHIHPGISLLIVMGLLTIGVLWSIYDSKKNGAAA